MPEGIHCHFQPLTTVTWCLSCLPTLPLATAPYQDWSQGVVPDTFSAPRHNTLPSREKQRHRGLLPLLTAKLFEVKVCPQGACWHWHPAGTATRRPGDTAGGAQACCPWGLHGCGAVGSRPSVGRGGSVCAEGRGVNPAPRKEEISAHFLSRSC